VDIGNLIQEMDFDSKMFRTIGIWLFKARRHQKKNQKKKPIGLINASDACVISIVYWVSQTFKTHQFTIVILIECYIYMHTNNYITCLCDVTLSVYPHRAGLKNMGGIRTYDLWNTSPTLRVTSHKHLIHLSTLHQHSKYHNYITV
jgi:hypothetical protein